jgi:hypothetical protein
MNTRLKWALIMLMTLSVFSLSSVAFSQGPAQPLTNTDGEEEESAEPLAKRQQTQILDQELAFLDSLQMQNVHLLQQEQDARQQQRALLQETGLLPHSQEASPFSNSPLLTAQQDSGDIPLTNAELISSIGGACNGLTMHDTIVYLGEGTTINVLDVNDATNPQKLATLSLPDMVIDMDVADTLLFVANRKSGIQIVDVSDPAAPQILGSYDTPGAAQRIDIVGNLVYVADALSGMHILDISDPTTPTLLGSYTDVGAITGVQVANSIAYLSDLYNGLLVLDVSNPAAPTLLGSYAAPQESWNLQLVDNLVYMTHYVADPPSDPDEPTPPPNDELHIIDVSNPAAPAVAGVYQGLNSVQNLFVENTLVYVVDYDGMKIVDVQDPLNPFLTGSISLESDDIVVQQNRVYIASNPLYGINGLFIADVSQPTVPKMLGSYSTMGWVNDVLVDSGNTFIAAYASGMHIIDEQSNLMSSFPMKPENTFSEVKDIAVAGSTAYVAIQNAILETDYSLSGSSVVYIYDISIPSKPLLLGNYSVQQYAYRIEIDVDGSTVFFLLNTETQTELHILDVSNPTKPQLLHVFPDIINIDRDQDTAYLLSDTGLALLDMSNPVSPTIRAEIPYVDGYEGEQFVVKEGKAYIPDLLNPSFVIIDVDPSSTTFSHRLGEYELPESESTHLYDLTFGNDMVYIASRIYTNTTSLSVIDVSRPEQPVLRGSSIANNTDDYNVNLTVSGDYLYLATGVNRLDIFNVSSPDNPRLITSHETSPSTSLNNHSVQQTTIAGKRAFLAAGTKGFEILDVSDPQKPTVIGGQTNTSMETAGWVNVIGEKAYLMGSGFNIIDVQDATTPRLLADYPGVVVDVYAQNTLLYTAEGGEGLRILDISTPTHPKIIGQYDTAGMAYGITVQDNIAYVADRSSGLLILNVSDPAAIELMGRYDTAGLAIRVQVRNNMAYIVDNQEGNDGPTGLRIIDVSNPASPTLIGSYATSSSLSDIFLEGNTAYLATEGDGVLVLDISNPANPVLQEQLSMPGISFSIQKVDDILHVANYITGYHRYRYNSTSYTTCLPLVSR